MEVSEGEMKGSRGGAFGFFAGMALLVAVIGAVWYFVVVRPAEDVAEGAMAKVEQFLGGLLGTGAKISREDSSSVLRVKDVGELALLEYQIKVSKEVEHEAVALHVLTSKKRLRMEGEFKVKVGYDITEGVSVYYDDSGRAVIGGLGEPKVLSAELVSVQTVEDTSGLWNKVDGKDRDEMVSQMRWQAIRDVNESGLLDQMDQFMRQNMKALLGVEDLVMEVETKVP